MAMIRETGGQTKEAGLVELSARAREIVVKTQKRIENTFQQAPEEAKGPRPSQFVANPLDEIGENLQAIIAICEETMKYFADRVQSKL